MGRSERANEEVLAKAADILGIRPQDRYVFDMYDQQGRKIYHTNVISWIGESLFAVCLDSIPNGHEKDRLMRHVATSGKTLINLSFDEVNSFGGNALEVVARDGQRYLTVSKSGYEGYSTDNRSIVDDCYQGRVLAIDIPTIQRLGGGSVRCMEAKATLLPATASNVLGIMRKSLSGITLDH
jgi:hypothetical protein